MTAFYEIVPVGVEVPTGELDPLRYQTRAQSSGAAFSGELLAVKLRYKLPDEDTSRLVMHVVEEPARSLASASEDLRFGASVALFGMLLRDSPYRGDANYELVRELAVGALGRDERGYRAEFVDLVALARKLD